MAGGGGERDADEETRNQMMQNLFGDQSEDEDDADDDGQQQQLQSPPHHHHEIEDDGDEDGDDARSDAPARHGGYHSEEVDGEAENGGEGEGESEGQVEMEEESEGEAHRADLDQGESDGDKVHSSPERELDDQRMESDAKGLDSEDEGYQQRTVSSRRRGVVASESEGSEDNYYADGAQEDEEPRQTRKQSSPMEEERDHEVVRDVFGDSDEDEPAPYRSRHEIDEESHRSPMEDEDQYEKDMQPDDTVADEDMRYESDENRELKPKEKPVGPPLDLVVPFKQPPARPDKMNVIKVSNIMGIDPKPFDPKTYVEEDVFVTDESGTKKRIRLEDNIVRWRTIRNADGTTSCESNARFVKWKDGSMQLLIGNEVLDISVHEAHHDQSHLFLRHGKGILQSQGRLLHKMQFMPSSLFSKSHRLLTALVDSQNKKTVKMQKWFETKDPEKAKMEKERIQGQNIRAHSILQRKREKVNRKYTQPARPRRQLSPGFLEDALDEDEEPDYGSRRMPGRRRFEDELEAEALAERRIINAKKSNMSRNVPRKPPYPPARLPRRQADEYSESEREESEYETDGEDIEHSPPRGREDELDEEEEYEEEVEEEAPLSDEEMEMQAPKRKRESGGGGGHMREELASEDDESPPRKQPTVQHRRKAVVFDDSDED
ncbi:protein LEO1 homolog isoform X1 [Zea mays]|uniref:Protein LEO1-like protein n=2 Tax=Zea mays TaxID=4577 RepID=A0A804Q3S4_MAIZE|nr:protein LEO1 homolog isoform X1 [Zea mays]|eukprot:XP_008651943.1 protein LEO1 homolog isoform X1 [Zea mays]